MTHLYYHITALALYMISHHITDVMIGRALQSKLIIYNDTLHLTGWDGEPLDTSRHVSALQQKSRPTEKHRRDGRVTHSWRPESWLGWRFVIRFDGSCQLPSLCEKRDDLLLCKNVWDEAGRPSRLLQGVWTVLGRSGAKWRGSPMQNVTVGGWASGG